MVGCCKERFPWPSSVSLDKSSALNNLGCGSSAQKDYSATVLEAICVMFWLRIWLLSVLPKNLSEASMKISGQFSSLFCGKLEDRLILNPPNLLLIILMQVCKQRGKRQKRNTNVQYVKRRDTRNLNVESKGHAKREDVVV